ncbi:DUF6318 family protein [Kineococcus sp. GCM10028916]|uniref:DUF6318 family protein n=1 Tax=Kineococcus sp. GCM10028916 TaxID=3273394 RepID=UPI00364280AF
MIQLHRAAAPLVALAATGLLVGCSNETVAAPVASSTTTATSGPVATPTPSATPVATPTPVATKDFPVPEQDDLSRTFTVDGAGTFAAYFTRVLNYSRATGDPTLLRSISDPNCGGCTFYAAEIDEYRSKGYSSDGFIVQFTGTRVDSWNPEAGEIGLTILITRPAFDTTDSRGNILGSEEGESNGEFWIDLNWVDDHWVVWEVQ